MVNLIDIGAAQQAYGNPTKLPTTQSIESKKQARTIADDFEAVFLGQMLKPMFEGIKPEAPFGGGNSEAMWRSMQIEEYGKAITKAGGIGIADNVYQEIIKLQEVK